MRSPILTPPPRRPFAPTCRPDLEPRGTPAKLGSFLWSLPLACFPQSHSTKGAEGRPAKTLQYSLHPLWLWPSGGPPRAYSLVRLPHPLPLPHFILSPLPLEVSVLFQPLFWLSLCLDPFPYHTPRVKGGVSRCFLLMVSLGPGCSVRTFLASAEL